MALTLGERLERRIRQMTHALKKCGFRVVMRMETGRDMIKTSLCASGLALALVTACGAPSGGSTSKAAGADCPPLQKGNGIMVSSRYDYEDLIEANKWRTDMFPASCAGQMAPLIPDMPDGFGVVPTNKPYIMTDDHVYLAYAELPHPLYLDEDIPNIPVDLNRIEFEIVRFTEEEMTTLRDWMAANSDNYLTSELDGQPVYLIGGFATMRMGKNDRLATSLHAFLEDGTVIRVSHKSLFTQGSGFELSPLVQTLLGDILRRAEAAGL